MGSKSYPMVLEVTQYQTYPTPEQFAMMNPPPPPPPMTVQPAFTQAITLAAEAAPQIILTPPVTTGLLIHVDGDFLAYNAAGNDDMPPGQARINCLEKLEKFRTQVGAAGVVVHSTMPGSTKGERYLVAQVKPYQGHRTGDRKPKNQPYLQDYLINYVGPAFLSKVWSAREADDGMSSCAQYALTQTPNYAVIVTKDKDMRMIPGVHIIWDSLLTVTVPPGAYDVVGSDGKQYGLKWFWLQMLQGDPTDNIPGLEFYKKANGSLANLGPKTAEKFLAGTTTSDQAAAIVMDLYEGCYQDTWADRFVEQASLLWMRCAVEPEVDDFITHVGVSRINTVFPPAVTAAAVAMKERVTLARIALDELPG